MATAAEPLTSQLPQETFVPTEASSASPNYAAQQSLPLPPADLLFPDDLKQIQDDTTSAAMWRQQFGRAKQQQDSAKIQVQLLDTKLKGLDWSGTMPPSMADVKKACHPIWVQINKAEDQLTRVNNTIEEKNKEANRMAILGLVVRTFAAPALERKMDSTGKVITLESIRQQTDKKEWLKHRKLYQEGRVLQMYHRIWLENCEYDKKIEDIIIGSIALLNKTLSESFPGSKSALLMLPEQGDRGLFFTDDPDYDERLEEEIDEEVEDDEMERVEEPTTDRYTSETDKPHVEEGSSEPSLGGFPPQLAPLRMQVEGPLVEYLMSKLQGNENAEALQKIAAIFKEEERICQLHNEDYAAWRLDQSVVDELLRAMAPAWNRYNELVNGLPETINAMQYAEHRNSVLVYFNSKFKGVSPSLIERCTPAEKSLLEMVQTERSRRQREELARANAAKMEEFAQAQEALAKAKAAREEADAAQRARTSHTSRTEQGTAQSQLPPLEDPNEGTAGITSAEDVGVGAFVKMDPGTNQKVYKRIVQLRRRGRNDMVVLKMRGTNPSYPSAYIYELRPGAYCKSSISRYKRSFANETEAYGKPSLTTQMLRDKDVQEHDVTARAVVDERRDPSKAYAIKPIMLFRLKIRQFGDWVTVSKTNLYNHFGSSVVDEWAREHRRMSGQKEPEWPTLPGNNRSQSKDGRGRRTRSTRYEEDLDDTKVQDGDADLSDFVVEESEEERRAAMQAARDFARAPQVPLPQDQSAEIAALKAQLQTLLALFESQTSPAPRTPNSRHATVEDEEEL